jgi:RNA polymerase sigma-70 factor (ECF subfamily)
MGPFGESTDGELIKLAAGGELKAFDALVRRYHRKVYGVALGILRDHDTADDICQEAFLRAHKALGRFREGSKFYTWIYRITVNLCLNSIRDRKRLVRIDDVPDGSLAVDPPQEAGAARKEEVERVNRALDKIEPKYRIALMLRVEQGLSYREISALLGVPKGTVMSRISRARERLKAVLGE